MFAIVKGHVVVTPVGATLPEYKALKKLPRADDLCVYLAYMYVRAGNDLVNMPLGDRREYVCKSFLGDDFDPIKEESKPEVLAVIELLNKTQMTTNEYNAEMMKNKAEVYRGLIMEIDYSEKESFKREAVLMKSLRTCTEFQRMYESEAQADRSMGLSAEMVIDYLFEVPEQDKPVHLKPSK